MKEPNQIDINVTKTEIKKKGADRAKFANTLPFETPKKMKKSKNNKHNQKNTKTTNTKGNNNIK